MLWKWIKTVMPVVLIGVLLAGCVENPIDKPSDKPLDKNSPYLLLVNKRYPLGESYVPEKLTVLDPDLTVWGKSIQLESAAAEAVEKLICDIREAGYGDIAVTSGYRTYAYQKSLFNKYLSDEQAKHPDWTEAECEAEVLTYSAKPGTSEHQTGLCVDLFDVKQMMELENYGHEGDYPNDVGFAELEAYHWLTKNAHRYGFILRYPEEKVAVTGYQYESWHYRYVGVEEATRIYETGGSLTLEEYLGKN